MTATILDVMQDASLFGKTFKKRLLRGDTWKSWRAFLAALFALPLDDDAREIYQRHTGRTDTPAVPFRESFVVVGRRGGKSLIAAAVAVFVSCFRDYSTILSPGETGVFMVIASDRRQARVIFNYVVAFLQSPLLKSMVVSKLKESITLSNNVRIEIHSSSFKSVRGFTLIGCVLDEIAFWPTDDSANPDTETLNALRPGMATVDGAVMLAISSPYSRRGALWEAYKENFGKPNTPVLVWQSDSRSMNPTLSLATVAMAYARDSAAASAEYGGLFRTDVEGFISREVVEARIIPGRFELPRVTGVNYTAFTDPSGGSSDSFTLSIAHRENDKAILDCVREVIPPFSPEQVVSEFAQVLKSYGVGTVVGDLYAGLWPREQFQKRGIEYKVSERARSEIYLSFLPMMMSGTVQLLDNSRLVGQLVSLDRRTARSGKDSVDHAAGSHDDVANAAAGALVEALGGSGELGLILYLKGLQSGAYREEQPPSDDPFGKQKALAFELKLMSLKPAAESRHATEVPPCPACQAVCTVKIGGVGNHCNNCGHSWDASKNPSPPSRDDLFSGRIGGAKNWRM